MSHRVAGSSPLVAAILFAVAPAILRVAPAYAAPAAPAAPPAAAAPAQAAVNPVEKPIRTLIGAVRFGKYPMALTMLDGEAQGKLLLGEEWAKGTPAQRAEFIKLFHAVFAKQAMPKIQKNFEHLESMVYEAPEITGDAASIKSVVTILHALKKQELKLKYKMQKVGADWKVVDVAVLGDSMLKSIREDQIIPIMKEGGWNKLLELLRLKA